MQHVKCKDMLENGFDLSFGRVSLSNVTKHRQGKESYQVHVEGDSFSEILNDLDNAVIMFLAQKKRVYNK